MSGKIIPTSTDSSHKQHHSNLKGSNAEQTTRFSNQKNNQPNSKQVSSMKQPASQDKYLDEQGRHVNNCQTINAIFPTVDVLIQDDRALINLKEGGNQIFIAQSVVNQLNRLKDKPGLSESVLIAARLLEAELKNPDGQVKIYTDDLKDSVRETLQNFDNFDSTFSVILAAKHCYDNQRDKFKKFKLVSLDPIIRLVAKKTTPFLTVEDYYAEHIDLAAKNVDLKTITLAFADLKNYQLPQSKKNKQTSSFVFKYLPDIHGELAEDETVICYTDFESPTKPCLDGMKDRFIATRHKNVLEVYTPGQGLLSGLKPYSKDVQNDYNWGQLAAIAKLKQEHYDSYVIAGATGSGKSLLGMGMAIERLDKFDCILVVCTMVPTGGEEKVGFLKGDLEDKLGPREAVTRGCLEIIAKIAKEQRWPIFEDYRLRNHLNFYESDLSTNGNNKKSKNKTKANRQTVAKNNKSTDSKDAISRDWLFEDLKKTGKLVFEPFEYLRGRTFTNYLIIIEDAQNLTKQDIKTVLTRAGEGTVVILNGDSAQVDRVVRQHGVVRILNGFAYAWIKLERPETAKISLTKTIRSRLAEFCENNL